MMRAKFFNPVCQTNINQMYEELYQFSEDLIDFNVPRRTRHSHILPLWITASTSKPRKRQQTQQQLPSTKLTSYCKRHVETLTVVVTEAAERYRLLYKEDPMRTRDTQMVFKHLKSLNKLCSLPKLHVFKCKISINVYDKVKMLNEFFQSVFHRNIHSISKKLNLKSQS